MEQIYIPCKTLAYWKINLIMRIEITSVTNVARETLEKMIADKQKKYIAFNVHGYDVNDT